MAGAFQTPQNEKSFSGMIDQVLLDTGRPAALLSAIQYANATLRECHTLGLFSSDMLEDAVPVDSNTGSQIWQKPLYFRKLRTAQYSGSKIYPKYLMPGRQLTGPGGSWDDRPRDYYYAADDYFNFAGVCLGENINVAVYYWPKKFMYYTKLGATNTGQLVGGGYTVRPAYFDKDIEAWQYLNADSTAYVLTLNDPTEEEKRRKNCMNWMLDDWYELIQEGTKNKVFNLFGDTRASATFSLYKSMQKDLIAAGGFESEGV